MCGVEDAGRIKMDFASFAETGMIFIIIVECYRERVYETGWLWPRPIVEILSARATYKRPRSPSTRSLSRRVVRRSVFPETWRKAIQRPSPSSRHSSAHGDGERTAGSDVATQAPEGPVLRREATCHHPWLFSAFSHRSPAARCSPCLRREQTAHPR